MELIITDEQKKLLLKYLPDEEKHIKADDINSVLLDLDEMITEVGFDSDYNLNSIGLALQRLYDEMFLQN